MDNKESLSAHLLFRGHPRCPHAKKISRYSDIDYCDIPNGSKVCLLELGNICDTWGEIKNERQDSSNAA